MVRVRSPAMRCARRWNLSVCFKPSQIPPLALKRLQIAGKRNTIRTYTKTAPRAFTMVKLNTCWFWRMFFLQLSFGHLIWFNPDFCKFSHDPPILGDQIFGPALHEYLGWTVSLSMNIANFNSPKYSLCLREYLGEQFHSLPQFWMNSFTLDESARPRAVFRPLVGLAVFKFYTKPLIILLLLLLLGIFKSAPIHKVKKLYTNFLRSPHFEPWFRKQRSAIVKKALAQANVTWCTDPWK